MLSSPQHLHHLWMPGVQPVVLMLKLGSVNPIPPSPWFPATACCLGLCLSSGQCDIGGLLMPQRHFKRITRTRCVLTCNPHASKTNNLCRLQRTILTPFPSRCPALSRAAPRSLVLHTMESHGAQGHTSGMQGACINAPRTDMHWQLRGK